MKVHFWSSAVLRCAGAILFTVGVTSWTWAQGPVREVYQQIDLGNNRAQLRMDPSRVQSAFDSLFILSDSVFFTLTDGIISPRGLAADSSITLAGGSGGGWNTMALGPNASASAYGAKALGSGSTASWTDAVATGRNATASKWASSAIGANSTASAAASTAIGHFSTASNWASVAMGLSSTASGAGSFALGIQSTSSGWNSMAMGSQSTASSTHSFAGGYRSTSSSDHAWAIGDSTMATSTHAMAFGQFAKAQGDHSHALGWRSSATGSHSNAFGYQSTASGGHGYALGWRSQATGWSSLALGQNAIASGAYALALGDSTVASGYNSLALGSYARSSGHNTVAAANNSEARSYREVQFGTFVDVASLGTADPDSYVPEEALFVIGNGTSDGARSNALVIRKDGAASFSDSLHVDENVDIDGNLNIDGRLDGDSATFTGVVNVTNKLVTDSISSAVGGHLNLRSALDVNVDATDDISLDAADDLNLEGRDIFIDVNEFFELRMDDNEDYIGMDDTGGGSEFLWLQDASIVSTDNLLTVMSEDGLRIAVGESANDAGIEIHDNSDIMIQYADSLYQPIGRSYFVHIDPSESSNPHPIMTGQEHVYLTDDLEGNWTMMQHFVTGDERNGNGNFLGIYGTEDISISAGYDAGLEFSQYFDAAVLYGDSIELKGETFVTDDLHVTGALTVGGVPVTAPLAYNFGRVLMAGTPIGSTSASVPADQVISQLGSAFHLNSGNIVVGATGYYELTFSAEVVSLAGGADILVDVEVNGGIVGFCRSAGILKQTSLSGTPSGIVNGNCTLSLTAGDAIQMSVVDISEFPNPSTLYSLPSFFTISRVD